MRWLRSCTGTAKQWGGDITVTISSVRKLVSLAAAAVVAVAGGVFIAPAAAAHGGPIELTLNSNGSGEFELIAFYEEDGHIVDAIMDPVLEAVSEDGATAGPINLVSSSVGQGRWVTTERVLSDGDWSVTVSTTTPEEASITIDVSVAPPDTPPAPPIEEPADEPAEQVATEVESTEEASADEAATDSTATTVPLWAIISLAAAVVVAVGVLVWRKRKV